MNIFLTLDYEIFFGEKSGTVDKCLIEPTNKILTIAKEYSVHYTFFWDIGHYIALKKWIPIFPELQTDLEKIRKQITEIVENGHDLELHIHPHWEKAVYSGSGWQMNLEKHYKLSDFPILERIEIFKKYKTELDSFRKTPSKAYRAGGWCIQPFTDFIDLFKENNVRFDSSVMPGLKWVNEQYQLDFQKTKSQNHYSFSTDVCQEDKNGKFVEYPISTWKYSALFFWKLYVLGRIFPKQHKMLGDGNFIAQPGGKMDMLTKGKLHHASTDGYFASKLKKIANKKTSLNDIDMVIIGHPKSLTNFSIRKLHQFIKSNHNRHTFLTFQDLP